MLKTYALMLSYDISDAEKQQAEKSLLCFDNAVKYLNKATDYLNIMATPFKDHPDIKTADIIEYRAALRRYRDKLIENFDNFTQASRRCHKAMQPFLSDTQILKLVNLFVSSIEEIGKKVNNLSNLFDDLESKTFVQDVNKLLDELSKSCDELKEIIEDRIIDYIKTNVIGKNWVNQDNDPTQQPSSLLMNYLKPHSEVSNDVKNKAAKLQVILQHNGER